MPDEFRASSHEVHHSGCALQGLLHTVLSLLVPTDPSQLMHLHTCKGLCNMTGWRSWIPARDGKHAISTAVCFCMHTNAHAPAMCTEREVLYV